ncbi:MAG: PH domain-containing protein [Rubrobacteraceae bacterium]|uniref:PH domain-containing protein n=1 Tax=Rubrobacter naiadicus TaxID=1392641 RepID=UPI002361BEB2|nr:PH domain-containing protein [Rubrobacter naiadicus]MBX6764470.1 PH domain-containing protein [Rubrobacteraceae bacterium]MCL6438608.1 PH domain-containing protein [Rubrobacteraceae bacterium]
MAEKPMAQAAARGNTIVNVYADRVEIVSGWQGQHTERIPHRSIADVRVRGLVNCTLTISTNEGRVYRLEHMALPDANEIRAAIGHQKRKAGLYG